MAATPLELAGARGPSLVCGIGPSRARRETARALAQRRPAAVLHVGIAGARRTSGIDLLAVVVGSAAIDCDGAEATVQPDARLVQAALRGLGAAQLATIGTSAAVGGSHGVDVEAMEGHAVLGACASNGVPAIEVRVISNHVEESDRSLWRFEEAFAEVARVTRILVPEIAACLS